MKKTINEIIEIDNSTKKIVQSSEEEIRNMKENLRKKIYEMESTQIEEAKKIAQDRYNNIIWDAEKEVEKRREENLRKIKEIDKNYDENKDFLVEKALKEFILNLEG